MGSSKNFMVDVKNNIDHNSRSVLWLLHMMQSAPFMASHVQQITLLFSLVVAGNDMSQRYDRHSEEETALADMNKENMQFMHRPLWSIWQLMRTQTKQSQVTKHLDIIAAKTYTEL